MGLVLYHFFSHSMACGQKQSRELAELLTLIQGHKCYTLPLKKLTKIRTPVAPALDSKQPSSRE